MEQMDRPSREVTVMRNAWTWSARSTCARRRVGAVIATNGRILSAGYNGAPAGMPHCDHTRDKPGGTMDGLLAVFDVLSPGPRMPPQLERDPACKIAVHAEANAIVQAARFGVPIEGTDMFTTMAPCLACASLIINAGLTRVYYAQSYRDPAGLNLLAAAGIYVIEAKPE